MIYITARIEVIRKTPIAVVASFANGVSVEAPKPTDGTGNGSAPSVPKDVMPEESEVYDTED